MNATSEKMEKAVEAIGGTSEDIEEVFSGLSKDEIYEILANFGSNFQTEDNAQIIFDAVN